jgi:hypothetical protein
MTVAATPNTVSLSRSLENEYGNLFKIKIYQQENMGHMVPLQIQKHLRQLRQVG